MSHRLYIDFKRARERERLCVDSDRAASADHGDVILSMVHAYNGRYARL